MKKLIRLTEGDLHNIVKEAIKNLVGVEGDYQFLGNDAIWKDRITKRQLLYLNRLAGEIIDIANKADVDADLLFAAAKCIDKFIESHKH